MVLKVAAGVFLGLMLTLAVLSAGVAYWQATAPDRERQACVAAGGTWTRLPMGSYYCKTF